MSVAIVYFLATVAAAAVVVVVVGAAISPNVVLYLWDRIIALTGGSCVDVARRSRT